MFEINSEIFSLVILPILIFLARIFDQSIGIVRILFATKGLKYLALAAGFFESLVWLLAISQIMQHLDNIFCYIAFAGGFATGNFVGIFIEQKLSIGSVIIRVIFQKNSDITIKLLRRLKFRLTVVEAMGMEGPVRMIFSTIPRRKVDFFIKVLKRNNPQAFYTIEDVRTVKEGYFDDKKLNFLSHRTKMKK